jgi:hypothetical protein
MAAIINCDYGWKGVLLILLLYASRSSKAAISAVMIAFCLFWGGNHSQITSIFGVPLNILKWAGIGSILSPLFRMQALAVFALPFMLIPIKYQIKLPKWLGYMLYPSHLAVLWFIQNIVVNL